VFRGSDERCPSCGAAERIALARTGEGAATASAIAPPSVERRGKPTPTLRARSREWWITEVLAPGAAVGLALGATRVFPPASIVTCVALLLLMPRGQGSVAWASFAVCIAVFAGLAATTLGILVPAR
jgi:hypothetical protein